MTTQQILTVLKLQLLQAQAFLATIIKKETSVKPMPTITTTLDKMCLAIRDFEGAPGDANYLNNNPGNVRYNEDGYLAKYEPVTKSPAGFAVFPSYDIGWMYLENMITQRIENHPNWTLLQFFQGVLVDGKYQGGYAPESDGNNPTAYASFVAKRLAVDISYQIKNILS